MVNEKFYWVYDPTLHLLLFFPKLDGILNREKSLWLKIINVCQLSHWSDWFTHHFNTNFKSGYFLLNDESVEALYQHFKPKYIWSFGQNQIKTNGLGCKIFQTQHPQFWIKHPLIKKQIWLIWLSIQQDLV